MNNAEINDCFKELKSGNTQSFETIYEDLKIPLFTVILRITKDRTLSEDILQEIFIKMYCSPPSPEIRNIRAWIFRIAHNLAVDEIRKSSHSVPSDNMENPSEPLVNTLTDAIDINKALGNLSIDEREIIALHINSGFKFKEIAEIIRLPMGTVLWKYHQALKKLRTYL